MTTRTSRRATKDGHWRWWFHQWRGDTLAETRRVVNPDVLAERPPFAVTAAVVDKSYLSGARIVTGTNGWRKYPLQPQGGVGLAEPLAVRAPNNLDVKTHLRPCSHGTAHSNWATGKPFKQLARPLGYNSARLRSLRTAKTGKPEDDGAGAALEC
jgi:hypothetical protein